MKLEGRENFPNCQAILVFGTERDWTIDAAKSILCEDKEGELRNRGLTRNALASRLPNSDADWCGKAERQSKVFSISSTVTSISKTLYTVTISAFDLN
jgi:hypothetical protein